MIIDWIRASLFVLAAGAATHCAPSAPALSADTFDTDAPLNPRLSDGRLIYRGYDDHHPTCFAFVGDAATPGEGTTLELECPAEALAILEACPSGKLYAHNAGRGCVCDPIGDDPPTPTDCPE
ncbi:MAG: hypothetical protein RIF41_40005 [Polyangiaceae bacterium]